MESKFLGSTGLAKFLENLYNVFSTVGHTHTKSQIADFPTIPSNVSQLTNDSGYITAEQVTTIIPVDSSLSETSENPVQNKTIKAEFDNVRDLIGEDSVQSQIDSAIKSIDSMNSVPNCTATDNGKFLRVVNGVATWSAIPYAEEATF